MTLNDYFAVDGARPSCRERAIFDTVMAHLEALGDVHVEPVSVGIFLKRSRGFAELRPKVNWVELSFGLEHAVDHPKIARVVRAGRVRTYHVVRLREPSDVDADVRDWLTEAYLGAEA